MDYAVRFGDKTVGKAQVTVEGLYYHVVCRCKLTGEVMVRLEAACGDKREKPEGSLGLYQTKSAEGDDSYGRF